MGSHGRILPGLHLHGRRGKPSGFIANAIAPDAGSSLTAVNARCVGLEGNALKFLRHGPRNRLKMFVIVRWIRASTYGHWFPSM